MASGADRLPAAVSQAGCWQPAWVGWPSQWAQLVWQGSPAAARSSSAFLAAAASARSCSARWAAAAGWGGGGQGGCSRSVAPCAAVRGGAVRAGQFARAVPGASGWLPAAAKAGCRQPAWGWVAITVGTAGVAGLTRGGALLLSLLGCGRDVCTVGLEGVGRVGLDAGAGAVWRRRLLLGHLRAGGGRALPAYGVMCMPVSTNCCRCICSAGQWQV